MRWVSASSEHPRLVDALDEASGAVQEALGGLPPHLLMVFASQHHLFDFGRVCPQLEDNFGARTVMGCSGAAVIGPGHELERAPGVSLLAAHLPDVELELVHLRDDQLPALDGSPQPWRDLFGVDPAHAPSFVVLGDPYSINATQLVQGIDYAFPGSTVVGGLASGASGPGATALFTARAPHRGGALVLALHGDVRMDALVAQGCRPVGPPARITECEGNLLKALDDRSPNEFLQDLFESAEGRERELLRHSLHLGLLTDESREDFGPGDFLIRNILGMQQETGAVAVGATLRPHQTVQFHVRDAEAATQELQHRLARFTERHDPARVAGGLQFSCVGRGESLFGTAHHDARALQDQLGALPAAGFFCNGEIGPVGANTWLHGFTTVYALFRPGDEA